MHRKRRTGISWPLNVSLTSLSQWRTFLHFCYIISFFFVIFDLKYEINFYMQKKKKKKKKEHGEGGASDRRKSILYQ